MEKHTGLSRRTVLQGAAAGSAALLLGDLFRGAPAQAAGSRLARISPEEVGIDPASILAFVEGVEQKVGGLHGLMLLRHGKVAAEGWWEPYAPAHRHMLYSLSKSFTSTAIGLAADEGRLKVDDRVISFFPDLLPSRIEPNLAAMRVRHLLSMSTGHDKDATNPMRQAPDGHWARQFFTLPVEHAPGSKFVYNSAATYMLSAIVQSLTGQTVLDYLRPRLFEPLGIEGPTWETCPRGVSTGGWGLSIRTEDIARFGQLYLQKGEWKGRRLVPAAWVAEATSKHIDNSPGRTGDWAQGYGYQFWRCQHGAYRGDGAFGQYCVVMPEQDAVLAITSGIRDMQAVLTLAWERLLPGMTGARSASTSTALSERLKSLEVAAPTGTRSSEVATRVSSKTYRLETNPEGLQSARPVFRDGECSVVLRDAKGERKLACGFDEWRKGTAPLADGTLAKVAARGAWTAPDTYSMRLCFYETPYVQTLAWKFNGDQVTLESSFNVGFGPTGRPPITGRAA